MTIGNGQKLHKQGDYWWYMDFDTNIACHPGLDSKCVYNFFSGGGDGGECAWTFLLSNSVIVIFEFINS